MHPMWKTIAKTIDPKAWANALNPVSSLIWKAGPIQVGVKHLTMTVKPKGKTKKPYALTLIVEVPSTGALLVMVMVRWLLPSGQGRVVLQVPLVALQSPERLIRNARNRELQELFSPTASVNQWQKDTEVGLFDRRADLMDHLKQTIRLAHQKPHLRPYLMPIIKEALAGTPPGEDDGGKGKGGKGKPSAIMMMFLHSHGDKEVRNPNYNSKNKKTKQKIKVKSLTSIKGPNQQKAMDIFNDLLEKFQESAEKKQISDKFKKKKKKRKDPSIKDKGKNVDNKDIKRRKAPTKKELGFGGIGKFKLACRIIERIDKLDAKIAAMIQG